MKPTQTTIGVFFGSRSPEHDVSIITGQLVLKGLRDMGYEAVPIYLSKEGGWYIAEELGSIEFFKGNDVNEKLSKLAQYTINLEESRGGIVFESSGFFKKGRIAINLAFPALHGPYGEDGTLQGLFEMFNVAYVGCGVTASALAMDKVITKNLYERVGIPTTDFVSFTKNEWHEYKKDILEQGKRLGFPLFVKPARGGSSIGIAKVETSDDLEFAVEVALHYDSKALIEKGVPNVADITVALLGNGALIKTSLIQESSFKDGFFTYEEKYLKEGGAQLGRAEKNITIPAKLDEKVRKNVENIAKDIYLNFECSGTARIDFLVDRQTNTMYANEINTMPGTLYHHLWEKSGVPLRELLKTLIRLAKERHAERDKITYTFDSNILSRANSRKLTSKLQSDNS